MMNVKVLSNQNYYMIFWKVTLDRHSPSVRWETGLCSLWVDGTKEMYLLSFGLFIWRKPLDQLICSFWNWRQSITEGICRLTIISAPTSLYVWSHLCFFCSFCLWTNNFFNRFWFSVQQLIFVVAFFLCQVFSLLQMIISFFFYLVVRMWSLLLEHFSHFGGNLQIISVSIS